MPENNELANMLRTVIQEELKPVNEKLTALESGQTELRSGQTELRSSQAELRSGQAELRSEVQRIEDTVNDIRATNRRTHKEVFSRLDYIVEDIKRLEPHEEKVIR